jgi:hypothetical protein
VSFSSQGIDEAFVVSLAAAHAKALLPAASSLTLAETGAQSPSDRFTCNRDWPRTLPVVMEIRKR